MRTRLSPGGRDLRLVCAVDWQFSLGFSSVLFRAAYSSFIPVFAFSALTLLVGRQEGHPVCKKTEWWGAGVVICLERDADLHTAQLMLLSLTVS